MSLTHIWNPPEDQTLSTSGQIVSQPVHNTLFYERLVGAQQKIKVAINNSDTGKNSEGVVLIAKFGRVVGIVHEVYKTSKGLVSAWVSSKSPNLTHNNGLLIVIKDEHCGK